MVSPQATDCLEFPLVEDLMDLSLSLIPDDGSEASIGGTDRPRKRFSHLRNKSASVCLDYAGAVSQAKSSNGRK